MYLENIHINIPALPKILVNNTCARGYSLLLFSNNFHNELIYLCLLIVNANNNWVLGSRNMVLRLREGVLLSREMVLRSSEMALRLREGVSLLREMVSRLSEGVLRLREMVLLSREMVLRSSEEASRLRKVASLLTEITK